MPVDTATAGTVYCFDFDGVLCDSMDESLITAHNAYYGTGAGNVSDIDPALRNFFYRHRRLVRPAEEYYPLFRVFENGETAIGPDRFEVLKTAWPSEMRAYAERFYACRKVLQRDMDHWLGLHRVYPQCADFLEKRGHRFFIVTNKDRQSIAALARHHGYADLIVEIYSREIAIKKKALLEKLIADHGFDRPRRRIIFVDDHAGTLLELKDMSLDLYQAAWGYTLELESSAYGLIHSLDELP